MLRACVVDARTYRIFARIATNFPEAYRGRAGARSRLGKRPRVHKWGFSFPPTSQIAPLHYWLRPTISLLPPWSDVRLSLRFARFASIFPFFYLSSSCFPGRICPVVFSVPLPTIPSPLFSSLLRISFLPRSLSRSRSRSLPSNIPRSQRQTT